ncbi:MAG: indolepyruvate oxidoreductase subunit beta [Syntrophorhabdus sp. PtaU1.Bin153]|nr:MAG: indolepyruvate oxidoreductase subunit beta [Syntrophorhabdus sp. PtaU1.Bin153]
MENNKVTNILLSGVGGQGAILASNILAHVFVEAGYDVKKSEVHGMAQRGGDVTTHFRYGKKVYSPLIPYGGVDFLLAFELVEALRYINHCKPEARIVMNDQKILPPAVNLGLAEYPEGIPATFRQYFKENVHVVKGQEIALSLGNAQAANVVLVGAFSNFFPEIARDLWIGALMDLLPKKIHDLNIKAFDKGKETL